MITLLEGGRVACSKCGYVWRPRVTAPPVPLYCVACSARWNAVPHDPVTVPLDPERLALLRRTVAIMLTKPRAMRGWQSELASHFGISRQRVWQIARQIREENKHGRP